MLVTIYQTLQVKRYSLRHRHEIRRQNESDSDVKSFPWSVIGLLKSRFGNKLDNTVVNSNANRKIACFVILNQN